MEKFKEYREMLNRNEIKANVLKELLYRGLTAASITSINEHIELLERQIVVLSEIRESLGETKND